jgi:hypothetical protein
MHLKHKPNRQCNCNVTLRYMEATVVTAEKQGLLHIVSVYNFCDVYFLNYWPLHNSVFGIKSVQVFKCHLSISYCDWGPGSSAGIETGYRMNGPGIESRWRRDFALLSRPALWSTQPPVQWVPGLSRGLKAAGAWRWPLTPSSAEV